MTESDFFWEKVNQTVAEMVQFQQAKLLNCAQRIISGLTWDDLLQPNDFPELENHPEFRYEEGTLHGLQMISMALSRTKAEEVIPVRELQNNE